MTPFTFYKNYLAPIVITPQDISIALNSPLSPTISQMIVTSNKDVNTACSSSCTVAAGKELSIKCGGTGNPSGFTSVDPSVSWAWTISFSAGSVGYTELVGCTGCTLTGLEPVTTAKG